MNVRNHPVIVYLGMAVLGFGTGFGAYRAIIKISGNKIVSQETAINFEEINKLRNENKKLRYELQVKEKLNSTISGFNLGDRDGWTADRYRAELIEHKGTSLADHDGFIKTCDREDGATTYFIAPEKFHGDLSSFTHLMFSLYSQGGDYYKEPDVRIKGRVNNRSISAEYDLLDRPKGTWETFLISLKDNRRWTIQENITLPQILKKVTSIEIRGEYGSGSDCTGLDNVVLLGE